MHHNTTFESGETLDLFEQKATCQEETILSFFSSRPHQEFTPDEVQQRVLPNAPITSVRRAISDLTKLGALEKTENKRQSIYGRPAHTWKLNNSI